MKTAEFDYALPPELIAQKPVTPRDTSRLMVVDRREKAISHHRFYDLPEFLEPGDLLVHNETRVIRARLFARKPTGGKVEILLLRQRNGRIWEALVGGRRVQPGLKLTLLDGPEGAPADATAEVLERGERALRVLKFDRPVLPLAQQVGLTPLPPYIHEALEEDERYQTIYAVKPGSAAAPTAGLHFTPELLHELRAKGVRSEFVTLHIGLDTFQPVREEWIENHEMHREYCSLSPEVARQVNETKLKGHRVVAVGTTSVRVLETAALPAAGGDAGACPWRAVVAFEGETDLFIYPGYEFRAIDALITNFHLPRSTLLMLVAAFAGQELIDRAYAEAVDGRYRFFSFGDAMLIL
ncbi:MAG: tRNA preQ1(34) S-adenosylmethionine ribosyltransferase-isomerase QueA [Chloroflexota bacterium]|nr:tRNA preQ1(34) S-adenosylmethionine ribosyltransferase-isomerase QueA [Chloroflexota bacterium]